jgi:hypothetical protein
LSKKKSLKINTLLAIDRLVMAIWPRRPSIGAVVEFWNRTSAWVAHG